MPLTPVGADDVRRNLANLTHAIMSEGAAFVIRYYGRDVAYLGPANTPSLAAQAIAHIQAGDAHTAIRLLDRITGAANGHAPTAVP